ncbi:hypothetical protein CUJ84_Chr003527 [Rhizobium leguminosarum]|uniref:Rad50/SbcC-type AAA domain-containing protein n=1 Tax=Rhizobium leguminosarum TaxID=384 RepID=A0A2K9Z6K0_RHILE|nr:hypothetical protein CUJ84_Chr003527 [Rhizobium leguminosarum]
MRNLRFEKLELLSLVERTARAIEFHPKLTVIKGPNDVGKSSVIKSLYWAFGAAPKSIHRKWNDAKVKAMVTFTIDGVRHSILRTGDTVAVFDGEGKALICTRNITKDLGPFIAGMLKFGLVFSNRQGEPEIPPPAFALLPFYVNQEGGWEKPFNSFDHLGQYVDFKNSVIDYHSGILGNEYYELAAERRKLQLEQEALAAERRTIGKAVAKLGLEADFSGLELTLADHEEAIQGLLVRLKDVRAIRQTRAAQLAEVLDQRTALDSQVRIAKEAISELEKDAKFAASLEAQEILCPTCGTVHQNDFANRFGILDDREACFEFLTRSGQEMRKLSEAVGKAQLEVRAADTTIAEIQTQLDEKRGDVSLRDVIKMEGRRAAAGLFDEQLTELDRQIGNYASRITEIEDKQDTFKDKDRREKVENFYAVLMLRYLRELDVSAIDHATVSKINGRISDTGSDQPRAVLAYDLAFLKTIYEFKGSFTAPMILDSPNQQDQDAANVAAMIKLIISERPDTGQTILGTVSMHGVEVDDGLVLEFDQKLSVLRPEEFDGMNDRMQAFFTQMQA